MWIVFSDVVKGIVLFVVSVGDWKCVFFYEQNVQLWHKYVYYLYLK